MADITTKQYLDYAGLSQYDGLIKTYTDSAKTKAIKKVLWDKDTEEIKFYKNFDAVVTDTPDFKVSVSSSDIQALQTRVGMDIELATYEGDTDLTSIINRLNGADTIDGSIAKILKDAIDALNGSAVVATEADGVVTIKGGVKEVKGILSQDDDKADIVLKKVATTAKAEDIDVAAKEVESAEGIIGYKLPAGTAQATAEHFESEIATVDAAVKALSASSIVTVEKQTTAETGYAATYVVKQNNAQVGEKINIPKDWLLKNVTIKTCTEADKPEIGYKVGDRYFDFEFNVKDGGEEITTHTYLKVEEMYDAYESGSLATDAVVIVVDNDNNTISATVTDKTIARAKITEAFDKNISDLEATHAAAAEGSTATYKTVAEEINDKVVTLDAEKDQAANAAATYADNTGLNLHIKEEDGKITEFSGSIDTVTPAQINGLFPA